MKIFFWVILVFLFLGVLQPLEAAPWGVRPFGLGGAFTAVADDENSLYYNPAGLTRQGFIYSWQNLDVSNVKFSQYNSNLLVLGSLGYASAGWATQSGSFFNQNILAWGNSSFNGLDWGVRYCQLQEKSEPAALVQTGWALDLGILAHLTPWLNLGLATENLLHANNNFNTSYRLGMAVFPGSDKNLILAADALYQKGSTSFWNYYTGAELNLQNGLKLRGGWAESSPVAGFGVDLPFFTLDYSVNFLSSGNYQKFGLGFHFLAPETKRRPSLFFKDKDVLVVEIGGPVVGGQSEWSFLGGYKSGADEMLGLLARAEKDPYLDGIVLHIYDFSSGLGGEALVQELRREILKIRQRGKKVVAYLDGNAGGREYYLASAADKIVTPNLSMAGGFGTEITVTKITELSKKLGFNWQIIKAGKFKSALSPFDEKIPEELKIQVLNLIKDIQENQLSEIAVARNLDKTVLKNNVKDGGLMTVQKARALGLIDEVGYLSDALEVSGRLMGLKESPLVIKPEDLYLPQDEMQAFVWPFKNKIAVVGVNGEIKSGQSFQNFIFGGSFTGAETVCEQIKKATEDKSIKAILVRINSGGGGELASAQIYTALRKAKKEGKTIVASLGDLAASGGYYIASASDKIVADSSTITGAIGVISILPDLQKFYEKIGLTHETFKTEKYADMFTDTRPLTDEEKKILQSFVDTAYDDFLSAVAQGRKMPKEKVALLAEGQIYTGSQAQKVGLVDELGNFYDAVKTTQKSAGIEGEPLLVYYNSRYDVFLPFELGGMSESVLAGQGFLKNWNNLLK